MRGSISGEGSLTGVSKLRSDAIAFVFVEELWDELRGEAKKDCDWADLKISSFFLIAWARFMEWQHPDVEVVFTNKKAFRAAGAVEVGAAL